MIKLDRAANALIRKQFDTDCVSIKGSITALQFQNEQLYLRIKALIRQKEQLIAHIKACINRHSLI
jgi:hypothetical protein